MAYITGLTKSGESWTPEFVESLDQANCIGCGRCYNVCTRDVFAPEEIEVDDEDEGCAKACSKGCFVSAAQGL